MNVRIMFITGKYPPQECGIGDYTQRLTQKLSRSGYQIFILTSVPQKRQNAINERQNNGVEIIRVITQWDFKDYQAILNEILKNKIDLVNIQFQISFFNFLPMIILLPFFLKLRRHTNRIRVVVTLHELAGPVTWFFPGQLRRLWLLPLIFWADAVIVTNERDLFLLHNVPFLKRRIHHIPLVSNIDVEQDIDKQAVRRRLRINDDEILILRFGFVNNIRATFILELIQAINKLCNKGHKVRLILVGGTDLKDNNIVSSFVNSLGIAERVIFTGYCSVQEVSQYLGSADIAVQLSPDGVFRSTALLATMAHGLPTIGLKKGYVPSVFVDRENILLIPKSTPEDIARGIEELILDEALRERLRKKSVQAVRGFNWEMVCKQIDYLYTSLFLNSLRSNK